MSEIVGRPIKILALSRNQQHIYAPLVSQSLVLGFEIIETSNWSPSEIESICPDILLTATCSSYESASCIEAARALNIPSLLLVDGITEWRNEWENPRFGFGGNMLHDHPIITDKIACLGWRSYFTYETWGNLGKCELIGSPRFDDLIGLQGQPRQFNSPRRVLIATANTPGFTKSQRDSVIRSLLDMAEVLGDQGQWEPVWRVTKGLDVEFSLNDRYPHLRGRSLKEVLTQVDAVVSTPSTILVESMLAGLPTAVMDYTNSPAYVQGAWSITAQEHIRPTLEGLFSPDKKRMLFQDELLHLNLECKTPAMPRLVWLIREMVDIGREARCGHSNLAFPYRIVSVETPVAFPSEYMDFKELYPDHPIFAKQEISQLHQELFYARQELTQLRQLVETRSIGYWISAAGRALYRLIGKYVRGGQ